MTVQDLEDLLKDKNLTHSKEAYFLIAKSSDELLKNRSIAYLKKIKNTHALFRKQLKLHSNQYFERKVLFKFFKTRFKDSKYSKTLGIALAFNFFSEYERFDFKHFFQLLRKQVPGIRVVEKAFYSAIFPKEKIIFCYGELEKIRGKHLTLSEYLKLKKVFAQEVLAGIEFLSPNLFIPKNEEEIYKNIARLNYELDNPKDLPLAMIFFAGQSFDKLSFNVILIRMLKSSSTPIKTLIEKLNLKVQFQIQKLNISKTKHMKEISTFSIELDSSSFFRRNHLVDLLKARQHVVVMLKQAIGEFRDYNGGLLSKQTEQFNLIKNKLSLHLKDFSFYEELFFSLTPSSLQPLTSPEAAADFFELFSKVKSTPLENLYDLAFSRSDQALSIIIKTTSSSVTSCFEELILDESITAAKIIKTIDQQHYCCLLQLNPFDLSLLKQIESVLLNIRKKLKHLKKTLKISFQEDLTSLHPHLNSDPKDTTLSKALFEGLTRINLQGKAEYAMAKQIKISPCKTRYTINLREAKWSNGEEVTSYHFVNAWKKAISSGTKCLDIKRFLIIKNVLKIFLKGKKIDDLGVYAPTSKQIIIELEFPCPYFLQVLSDPTYSPLFELNNQEPNVFNGPFIIEDFNTGKEITLSPNTFYWDIKNVKLRKIKIYLDKDISQATQLFEKGKIDYLGSPINIISKTAINDTNKLSKLKGNGIFFLFCNTKIPKLSSSKIRKALSFAINRDKIIKEILPLQGPCYDFLPENLSLFKPDNFFSKKTRLELKQLFFDGLKDIGIKKENYFLNLSYSNISPERNKLSCYFKQVWEETFEIQVNIIEKEWNIYWNNLFNNEFEIGGYCTLASYYDPMYFLDPFLNSKTNLSKWENPKFQKLIKLSAKANSDEKRNQYLKMAEEILLDEMPVIPVYSDNYLSFCNKALKSFSPTQLVYVDFKWAYFDE